MKIHDAAIESSNLLDYLNKCTLPNRALLIIPEIATGTIDRRFQWRVSRLCDSINTNDAASIRRLDSSLNTRTTNCEDRWRVNGFPAKEKSTFHRERPEEPATRARFLAISRDVYCTRRAIVRASVRVLPRASPHKGCFRSGEFRVAKGPETWHGSRYFYHRRIALRPPWIQRDEKSDEQVKFHFWTKARFMMA